MKEPYIPEIIWVEFREIHGEEVLVTTYSSAKYESDQLMKVANKWEKR